MDFMAFLHVALHFDQQLGGVIARYGDLAYLALFAVIFCEIGLLPLFFLPGDPLLFICGAFCATGAINVWGVMAVLFIATVAGSTLNYRIGRAFGQAVFTRDYRWLDKAALAKTHAFYEKHGSLTFFLSPYVAVVRTFAPFVAGVSAMSFAKFMLSVTAGAAVWVVILVGGGYFFGNLPLIRDHLGAMVLIGVTAGVGSLLVGGLWKYWKRQSLRRSRAQP